MQIRDVDLEVEERGDGQPFVLVHGSASDRRTWRAQLDEFAKHYRVVCYSRRYHWPNQPIADGRGYSMREQLDDLRAVVESRSPEPAHLVGHSYGAVLCLRLAVEEPHLVRSLVLVEPPAFPLFISDPPTPAELVRTLVRRPRTALALIKFGARGLGPAREAAARGDMDRAIRVFGKAVLGDAAFGTLSEDRWQQVLANNIRTEYLAADYLPLPAESLRRIAAPTLLVTGARSPRLFHRLADRLEELLSRSQRMEIPGASHLVHEDNPVEFNSAVRAFLNGEWGKGHRAAGSG